MGKREYEVSGLPRLLVRCGSGATYDPRQQHGCSECRRTALRYPWADAKRTRSAARRAGPLADPTGRSMGRLAELPATTTATTAATVRPELVWLRPAGSLDLQLPRLGRSGLRLPENGDELRCLAGRTSPTTQDCAIAVLERHDDFGPSFFYQDSAAASCNDPKRARCCRRGQHDHWCLSPRLAKESRTRSGRTNPTRELHRSEPECGHRLQISRESAMPALGWSKSRKDHQGLDTVTNALANANAIIAEHMGYIAIRSITSRLDGARLR